MLDPETMDNLRRAVRKAITRILPPLAAIPRLLEFRHVFHDFQPYAGVERLVNLLMYRVVVLTGPWRRSVPGNADLAAPVLSGFYQRTA